MERNTLYAVIVVVLVVSGVYIYTHPPTPPPPPQQGVATRTTVTFWNGTAANSGTLQLVEATGKVDGSGPISGGAALTASVLPGTYYRLVSGVYQSTSLLAAPYVDMVEVTNSTDASQTYLTLPAIQLYRNSTTYNFMLSGLGVAYSRAQNGAGMTSKNFTLTAQTPAIFTLTITESMGFAKLLESYRDPITGVSCQPVLWLQVASTTIYTNTPGITTFANSTANFFLVPLTPVYNFDRVADVATVTFTLTIPAASQTCGYQLYIDSYSDISTLSTAKAQVANALGPFTLKQFILCSGWLKT